MSDMKSALESIIEKHRDRRNWALWLASMSEEEFFKWNRMLASSKPGDDVFLSKAKLAYDEWARSVLGK